MYKWIILGLFLTSGLSLALGLVALAILRRRNVPEISSMDRLYELDHSKTNQSKVSEDSQEASSLAEEEAESTQKFQKSKSPKSRRTHWIEDALYEPLSNKAKEEGKATAELVNRAIRRYLEDP